MLAELSAANAAFAILKNFVMNGKELSQAGSAFHDYVTAKDLLQKKAAKRKGSLIQQSYRQTLIRL